MEEVIMDSEEMVDFEEAVEALHTKQAKLNKAKEANHKSEETPPEVQTLMEEEDPNNQLQPIMRTLHKIKKKYADTARSLDTPLKTAGPCKPKIKQGNKESAKLKKKKLKKTTLRIKMKMSHLSSVQKTS